MATWEDGPEYAPHEPPEHFAAPAAEPLSVAPPRHNLSADAPLRPPQNFTAPQAPPLTVIGTGPSGAGRNPIEPFAVAAATMTDGTSAWGAAHSMRNAQPADEQWAPPAGTPTVATTGTDHNGGRDPLRPIRVGNAAVPVVPPPDDEPDHARWAPPAVPVPAAGPPSPPAAVPPAGGWARPSGAPMYPTATPAASGPVVRRMADLLTIPLVVSLALGLIPPIAPVMLVVSLLLSFRLEARMTAVRNGIIAGTGYLVFIAVLSQLSSDWWGTTTTWAWVVNIFVTIYAGAMAHLTATRGERNRRGN